MSRNLFVQFKKLLPDAPLQVGVVLSVSSNVARVELPGGGVVTARGATSVGQRVFVRDGAIEGPAPNLPLEVIEV
jgi:hypothetical protein